MALRVLAAAAAAEMGMVAAAPPLQKENTQQRGDKRVWVRYNAHLPALYLQEGENLRSILAGRVLLTLHGAVLCNNCHLCGSCWEDCKRKRSHVPTPPEVPTTVAGLLMASRGE